MADDEILMEDDAIALEDAADTVAEDVDVSNIIPFIMEKYSRLLKQKSLAFLLKSQKLKHLQHMGKLSMCFLLITSSLYPLTLQNSLKA